MVRYAVFFIASIFSFSALALGEGVVKASKTLVKPSDVIESTNVVIEPELEALKDISNKETQDFSKFEKQSDINKAQTLLAEKLKGMETESGNSNAVSLISDSVFGKVDGLIEPEINEIQSSIQNSLSALLNSEGEESGFQNTLSRNISSNFGSIGSNGVKDLYKSASKSLGGDNSSEKSLESFQKNLAKLMSVGLVNSLIDSAVEQSKESSIYGLKNLELEYNYGLKEDPNVRLSLFQPLIQSKEKDDVFFTQLSFAYGKNELDSPNDDKKRTTINLGLGYRYITGEIPQLYNTPLMLGLNSFVDYQKPYDHLRASIGGEIKTANLGLTFNRYIPINDFKNVDADSDALFIDYQEKVLGGYDFELSGYVPQTNIELFAKRSVWRQYENEEDIFADKFSAKYSPNKMFSLEVGYVKEKRRQGLDTDGLECSVGVTYNFDEPLDDQLKFTKFINLTEKQVSDRLFEKVRRENNIRVQNACYASGDMFTPAPDVATVGFPSAIKIGYFDAGGNLDFAVTSNTEVSIKLGNGLGGFSNGPSIALAGTGKPAFADLDNNGSLDLAIPNFGANAVSIYLNNGFGAFLPVVNVSVGTLPLVVEAGDLDNDGDLDLVVSNYSSNNISVLKNNGSGVFAVSQTLPSGTNTVYPAIADFNNDGYRDIAVSNPSSNNITSYFNDGTGNFIAGPTITGLSLPSQIIAYDFNKDGNIDIISTNQTSNVVSLFFGDGKGNFNNRKDFKVGESSTRIDLGDFNRDGKTDIAVAQWADTTPGTNKNISILLGDDKGNFCAAKDITLPRGLLDLATGDFNNDGKADILAAGYDAKKGDRVYVLLGK